MSVFKKIRPDAAGQVEMSDDGCRIPNKYSFDEEA